MRSAHPTSLEADAVHAFGVFAEHLNFTAITDVSRWTVNAHA